MQGVSRLRLVLGSFLYRRPGQLQALPESQRWMRQSATQELMPGPHDASTGVDLDTAYPLDSVVPNSYHAVVAQDKFWPFAQETMS